MQTLINFCGNEDFKSSKFPCRVDQTLYFPFSHCVDVLSPARKRLRAINNSEPFRDNYSSRQKKPFSLDNLPEEILFEIFRRLPSDQDRSICASVSKKWLMLQSSLQIGEFKSGNSEKATAHCNIKAESKDDKNDSSDLGEEKNGGDLSRRLEGKKATDVRLAAISIGSTGHGGLGKLEIRGNHPTRGVTDLGLSAIGHGCPNLRVLALWDCPQITDNGLRAIAKGCPLLEKIDLLRCSRISDSALEAISRNCPNLSTLNIESCPRIVGKSFATIGRLCRDLQSVSINNCVNVGDQGIISLLSNSPKLRKLKLQSLKVTDLALAAVGHFSKGLVELKLACLQNLTQRSFQYLAQSEGMPDIKSVSFTFCKGFTDNALVSVGQGCPSLKQANFCKLDGITDEGLKGFSAIAMSLESLHIEECQRISCLGLRNALANGFEKLKGLEVVKCDGIKDSGIGLAEFQVCGSLKTLAIQNCRGFGNECLALLGMICPQVQSLELIGLTSITDDGLFSFLGSCKTAIVKMNLSGCIEITDRAVFIIANLFGKSLQSLNFEGCRKLTDQTLCFIAKWCLDLQELDVSNSNVTDNGLVLLASTSNEGLQVFSLSGCLKITDNSLPYIEKVGKNMVGLNLQHCSGIRRRALDMLGAHLWWCDILA